MTNTWMEREKTETSNYLKTVWIQPSWFQRRFGACHKLKLVFFLILQDSTFERLRAVSVFMYFEEHHPHVGLTCFIRTTRSAWDRREEGREEEKKTLREFLKQARKWEQDGWRTGREMKPHSSDKKKRQGAEIKKQEPARLFLFLSFFQLRSKYDLSPI